jgi:multiple sugar transport system permease protein
VVNTILYLALGVNVKMFLALLLSGFFMRPGWWMKAAAADLRPAVGGAADLDVHLDPLDAERRVGILNNALYTLFHVEGRALAQRPLDGPGCGHRLPHLEMDAVLDADPARGRMAIPLEIRDTARVDGATGVRGFVYITFPLLANLYLISTCSRRSSCSATSTPSISSPAAAPRTRPRAGHARHPQRLRDRATAPRRGAVMSALPLVIPLVIVLMRKLRTAEVQL